MAFNIEQFGSDSSNIKSIFGGANYYRYFNKSNDNITTAGYFPSDLGLEIGDRICVIPSNKANIDEWYVVSSISGGKVSVTAWAKSQPDLTSATGYDDTKTQTLKNVEGVLTWVDDE